MKEIAEEEVSQVWQQIEDYEEDIIEEIIPKQDAEQRNCTLEVMQAAGGSESSLFAGDLFEMYQSYCRIMGFKAVQTEFQMDFSINKGCKKGVLQIKGQDVYKHLKHESGVHKV